MAKELDEKTLIRPRTLKGFRDFLPALAMQRERLSARLRRVFRSYGFVPIETPVLEYSEILLAKGGAETDKQIYRFRDHGGRDVALRYDLTVPLARFAAQHIHELGTPFKRYQIGAAWRGENTQHGRYREFVQCDFDTIGTEGHAADIETAFVIHDLMVALGFEDFTIHLNHRLLLNQLLEQLGLSARGPAVLRALDKLPKIGAQGVEAELRQNAATTAEQAAALLEVVRIRGGNSEILDQLEKRLGSCKGALALAQLRQGLDLFEAAGIPAARLRVDLSIARGMDYYTGMVYETFLDDLPGIGSVCSGGRYDNLAGAYTRQPLPGVGASLGLDRLLRAMEELDLLETGPRPPAPILIVYFVEEELGRYIRLARRLRAAALGAEVYPECKAMGRQLRYADRKGFRIALIGGPEEWAKNCWQLKDLRRGSTTEVADADLISSVRGYLDTPAPGAARGGP